MAPRPRKVAVRRLQAQALNTHGSPEIFVLRHASEGIIQTGEDSDAFASDADVDFGDDLAACYEANPTPPDRSDFPGAEIPEVVEDSARFSEYGQLDVRPHIAVSEMVHLDALLGVDDEASFIQEAILAETFVEPPQLTRLGKRLGLSETVISQDEFLAAYKNSIQN